MSKDIEDPEWLTDVPGVIPSEREIHSTGYAHEGVRTLHGVLDALHGIEEDVLSWVEREAEHGKDVPNEWVRKNLDHKVKSVETVAKRPNRWRATTYSGLNPNGQKIVEEAEGRSRVIITNWGPGILYLSHASINNPASVGAIQVPVNGSREFKHEAAIYAVPATGNNPVIDVQEEGPAV